MRMGSYLFNIFLAQDTRPSSIFKLGLIYRATNKCCGINKFDSASVSLIRKTDPLLVEAGIKSWRKLAVCLHALQRGKPEMALTSSQKWL
jgi:hypothetical protein